MPTPFIREWGDGPTVLFIHGLAGSTRYWDSVAEAGTGYRGVAAELRAGVMTNKAFAS